MGLFDNFNGSASDKRKAALRVLIFGPYESKKLDLEELRCVLVNNGYIQASLVADFKDSPELPSLRKKEQDRIYFRKKSLDMIMDSQARIFVFYLKHPSYIESIEHDHSIEAGLGASNLVLSDNWKRISKLIKQQAAANQSSIEEFSSIDDVKIKTISFLGNLVDDVIMLLDNENEMKWIPLFKDNLCKGCKNDCPRKKYLPL